MALLTSADSLAIQCRRERCCAKGGHPDTLRRPAEENAGESPQGRPPPSLIRAWPTPSPFLSRTISRFDDVPNTRALSRLPCVSSSPRPLHLAHTTLWDLTLAHLSSLIFLSSPFAPDPPITLYCSYVSPKQDYTHTCACAHAHARTHTSSLCLEHALLSSGCNASEAIPPKQP